MKGIDEDDQTVEMSLAPGMPSPTAVISRPGRRLTITPQGESHVPRPLYKATIFVTPPRDHPPLQADGFSRTKASATHTFARAFYEDAGAMLVRRGWRGSRPPATARGRPPSPSAPPPDPHPT